MHQKQKQFEKAEQYYKEALNTLHKAGDPIQEADVLTHIGLLHLDLGSPDKSLDYYKKISLLLQSTSLDPDKNPHFVDLRQRLMESGFSDLAPLRQ